MNEELMLKYSETFYSPQGEGNYVGRPSLWMRFFLCNLQCDGFGQDDPTNPDTYELPYETLDLTDITDVMDLPVFSKGCDSSYTWSKRYRHLITDRTVTQAVDELEALLPHGKFVHPKTFQNVDMVFTGGEPMIKNTQPGMVAIMREFCRRGNYPARVTVETNGTRVIQQELFDFIEDMYLSSQFGGVIPDDHLITPEWFWSVSPKLWSTAGEKPEKAIRPDVVAGYAHASDRGQLKYVVNGSEESWREVEEYTQRFRDEGVSWPIWIMGVGGTVEGLKLTEADICDEAIQRGYNYTSRVHAHIYGNAIGK
jgi:6-pyruvoyltetrahydropterin 2'-reductase